MDVDWNTITRYIDRAIVSVLGEYKSIKTNTPSWVNISAVICLFLIALSYTG